MNAKGESGILLSYSNFSFALVGPLVEDAVSMLFVQYPSKNIFQPLGLIPIFFSLGD